MGTRAGFAPPLNPIHLRSRILPIEGLHLSLHIKKKNHFYYEFESNTILIIAATSLH